MMNLLAELRAQKLSFDRINQDNTKQGPGKLRRSLLVSAISAASIMAPTVANAQLTELKASTTTTEAETTSLKTSTATTETKTTTLKTATVAPKETTAETTAVRSTTIAPTERTTTTTLESKTATTEPTLTSKETTTLTSKETTLTSKETTAISKEVIAVKTGSDATLSMTEGVKVGSKLALSVNDSDKIGAGTITADVRNATTGESEVVTLIESTVTPGLFEASMDTEHCADGSVKVCVGSTKDNKLSMRAGETLRLSYTDELDSTGATKLFTKETIAVGGTDATITMSEGTKPGEKVTLSVTDADEAGNGKLNIQVENVTTGELETVTLIESTATPGLFEAQLDTAYCSVSEVPTKVSTACIGSSDDGKLSLKAGETIRMKYTEALDSTGGSKELTRETTAVGGTDATITMSEGTKPGEKVTLSVTDADEAGNGKLNIQVENVTTGELETVTLIESTTTPGLFEAQLDTAYCSVSEVPTKVVGACIGSSDDGKLSLKAGETIRMKYTDALDTTGGSKELTKETTAVGGKDAIVSMSEGTKPGEDIVLSITDEDEAGKGSIIVQVENVTTGELESVTLIESTLTPGLFEAPLATEYCSTSSKTLSTESLKSESLVSRESKAEATTAAVCIGASNDNKLSIRAGETVRVKYTEALDSTGGSKELTKETIITGGSDATITMSEGTKPGEKVTLSVTDADEAGKGKLNIQVENVTTGELETVTLIETATPGLFEAQLDTEYCTSAPTKEGGTSACIGAAGDNKLSLRAGETLRMKYTEALDSTGGSKELTKETTAVGGSDATVSMTEGPNPGDPVTLSVIDADEAGKGSIVVQVENVTTGELEDVTLIESTETPGLFEKILDTEYCPDGGKGVCVGTTNDGKLSLRAGETLSLKYTDSLDATGGSKELTKETTAVGGSDATVSMTEGPNPGDPVTLSVVDADEAGKGSIVVQVENVTTGELEDVTLIESTETPGLFEKVLDTEYCPSGGKGVCIGTTNDGKLSLRAGETLSLKYTDSLDATGGSKELIKETTAVGGSDATVSMTEGPNPGDPVTLSVVDADEAGKGSIVVQVENVTTGELEDVTLIESTETPGLFEKVLDTEYCPDGGKGVCVGTTNDGKLSLRAGETLSLKYTDSLDATGGSKELIKETIAVGGVDGEVTVSADPKPGDTVNVSVTDGDLIGTGTLDVTVTNPATGEEETVTLIESTETPGTFTGSVGTKFGTATGELGDGSINVKSGDKLSVSYTDTLTSTGGVSAKIKETTIGSKSIFAGPDVVSQVDGRNGSTNVLNVLDNDTLDGVKLTQETAILSLGEESGVPAYLTFDTTTGVVSVKPGTPAGIYTFNYKVCEAGNPLNCKTETVSITVDAAEIIAVAEVFTPIGGTEGGSTPSILTSDTLGGKSFECAATGTTTSSETKSRTSESLFTSEAVAETVSTSSTTVSCDDVIITIVASSPELSLNTDTGVITVASNTPAGEYTVDYKICEKLNSENCSTATETVVVEAADITASPDTVADINGSVGNPSVINVLDNDTVGKDKATAETVTLSIPEGSSLPESLTFDILSGVVGVKPGTPAGEYTFTYQICETLNPENCKTENVSIVVKAGELAASPDSVAGVDGLDGEVNVINVLDNDTLNGDKATPETATLSIPEGSSLPTGITLNLETGSVSVAPGTPAGEYTFDYKICETLNPENCAVRTVSVAVDAAAIIAVAETFPPITGNAGGVTSHILASDTLGGKSFECAAEASTSTSTSLSLSPNGSTATSIGSISGFGGLSGGLTASEGTTPTATEAGPLTPTFPVSTTASCDDVIITITASSPELSLNTDTGLITVASNTPAGEYTVDYKICEKLNSENCSTATETVIVEAADLTASPDSAANINGSVGDPSVLNVLDNDTLGEDDATPETVTISIPEGSSIPEGLTLDLTTGVVGVTPGTPAGEYTFTYQICETLNPENCKTETVSVVVKAGELDASPDTVTDVDGFEGAPDVINVLDNDTLNGDKTTPETVTLSIPEGSSLPEGITLNLETGSVSVAPGTPAGTYTFNYEVCEKLNPTNCAIKPVSITIEAAAIIAVAEVFDPITGNEGGTTPSILTSDTLGGNSIECAASGSTGGGDTKGRGILSTSETGGTTEGSSTVSCDDIIITVIESSPELSLDTETAIITVASNTPAGEYTVDYKICEKLNPENCSTATETVIVDAANIAASPDSAEDINGFAGDPSVLNVLDNDTLGEDDATPETVTISIPKGSSIPEGLTLDLTTGVVGVTPDTPAGEYTFTYQICETLNPENCKTETVSVVVKAGDMAASDDTAFDINGKDGATDVINVLTNDTLNGDPMTPETVTVSLPEGTSLPEGISLNTETGSVSVAPGTPADTYTFNYEVCETLNPENCIVRKVTVEVEAAAIKAAVETFAPINGTDGGTTKHILTSDTLNGDIVDPSEVTITVNAADEELSVDPATGLITVAPGTPAGSYTVDYTFCETLNAENCDSATETVSVDAAEIKAVVETFAPINGTDGGTTKHILTSDTLNGDIVDPSEVTITVNSADEELSVDPATGLITVAPGTPAGTYTVDYTYCENLNATNCDSATETVTIGAPDIDAAAEVFPPINGTTGGTTSTILASDTINGTVVDPSDVTITVVSSAPELVLDPSTSLITVAPGTAAGAYAVEYQICEDLNPSNCATATETITVASTDITAAPETFEPINSSTGGETPSILTSDTFDGQAVDPSIVTVTVGTSSPELVLDPDTGIITVASNTPAGTYTVDYTICETLVPTNCADATETVTVEGADIVAQPDNLTGIVTSGINVTEKLSAVLNVLGEDTFNGQPATTETVLVKPAPGTTPPTGFTLNPDGTIDVDMDTPEGTYIIEYQICDIVNPENCATSTATVTINPPKAGVNGIVFVDKDGDGVHSSDETLLTGWIVEIMDEDGEVVATVNTDENGYYEYNDLPIGMYSVVFRNPETQAVYGKITEIDLKGGQTKIDQNLPIDPSGIVYDSITRAPIPGVIMTMTTASGVALPGVCFVDPMQQNQPTDSMGFYRFDIIPGNAPECPLGQTDYAITFDAVAGYKNSLSTVIGVEPGSLSTPAGTGPYLVAPQSTAPAIGEPTTYYLAFTLGTGSRDVIHNHIPLDATTVLRSPMSVTKVSPKRDVSFGDIVPYTITATNTESLSRVDIDIIDYLPAGFKFIDGTALLNGTPVTPTENGREISFEDLDFAANETKTIQLSVVIGAGIGEGVYTNLAYTEDPNGDIVSDRGEAAVRVSPTPVFDCSELIGKVFDDQNQNGYQDEGEKGLAGVRLATAKGLLVTTDKSGRYHIACAAIPNGMIGSNFILKVDERTLPTGYRMSTENPRVVRLTRGKMSKANFGASMKRVVTLDLADAAFIPGEVSLNPATAASLQQLVTTLKRQESTLRLNYHVQPGDYAERAEKRLKAVSQHLEDIWDVAGCCYTLNIEQKLLKSSEQASNQTF